MLSTVRFQCADSRPDRNPKPKGKIEGHWARTYKLGRYRNESDIDRKGARCALASPVSVYVRTSVWMMINKSSSSASSAGASAIMICAAGSGGGGGGKVN